jgi:hypothetical protein
VKKYQDIEYDYEYDGNGKLIPERSRIVWNGEDISILLPRLLSQSKVNDTISAYDTTTKTITFSPQIKIICHNLFPVLLHIKKEDEYASAAMASYIFEQFTLYWEYLLSKGKDLLGLRVWEETLNITYEWENSNNAKIHKGTPYFFLAENYILLGDRDLAFHFLLNGLEGDRILGERVPTINYPWESPGYLTAIISDDERNHMVPLVRRLRKYLEQFLVEFRQEFGSNFTINQFDQKFLQDRDLLDIVIVFHFNLLYIYDLEARAAGGNYLENDFSKLRGLDVFFNFTLVIDEVLKKLFLLYNAELKKDHNIRHSILWFCDHYNLMNHSDLKNYWGVNDLKLNESDPDKIIPRLLNKSDIYKGNNTPVPKEVSTLLIAYKFRNYGAHNIRQQSTVVSRYHNIVKNLLFSLFLSVEKL